MCSKTCLSENSMNLSLCFFSQWKYILLFNAYNYIKFCIDLKPLWLEKPSPQVSACSFDVGFVASWVKLAVVLSSSHLCNCYTVLPKLYITIPLSCNSQRRTDSLFSLVLKLYPNGFFAIFNTLSLPCLLLELLDL